MVWECALLQCSTATDCSYWTKKQIINISAPERTIKDFQSCCEFPLSTWPELTEGAHELHGVYSQARHAEPAGKQKDLRWRKTEQSMNSDRSSLVSFQPFACFTQKPLTSVPLGPCQRTLLLERRMLNDGICVSMYFLPRDTKTDILYTWECIVTKNRRAKQESFDQQSYEDSTNPPQTDSGKTMHIYFDCKYYDKRLSP